jgi:hypothetical protein
MKTKTTIMQWGLSLLAVITFVPTANAVVINFSVHHSDDDGIVTSTNLSGPNGVAAGLETWNLSTAMDLGGFLATQSSLLDAAGATTGVGVSFTDLGGPDDWGYNSDLKLLWRSARQFYNGAGNAGSFTITGLTPGATFDLWIATSHVDTTTVGDWTTTNTNTTGATVVLDNTGFESNGSTWVSGVNYVLFENIEASGGGDITMTEHLTTLNGSRVGFNGFQLVSVVPEPSSAALLGLGAFALILRRRK